MDSLHVMACSREKYRVQATRIFTLPVVRCVRVRTVLDCVAVCLRGMPSSWAESGMSCRPFRA